MSTVAAEGFPASLYLVAREWMLANDPDAQQLLEWSRDECKMPETPEDLAGEVIWIILCAGRSAQAARTLESRVWKALDEGRPVVEAFGYRAKAAAIERAWRERAKDFEELQAVAAQGDLQAALTWGRSIPFVGNVTVYQLLKNFGYGVAKPDRWLSRFSGIADDVRISAEDRFARCQQLALELSAASGDTVPIVDSLLYLAGNKSLLRVSFDPHTVVFEPPSQLARRSIYQAAPEPAASLT